MYSRHWRNVLKILALCVTGIALYMRHTLRNGESRQRSRLRPTGGKFEDEKRLEERKSSDASQGKRQGFSTEKVRTYEGKTIADAMKDEDVSTFDVIGDVCEKWAVFATDAPSLTRSMQELASMDDWCVVIVCENDDLSRKGPKDVTYLTPSAQERLPYRTARLLPRHGFGRKNIGYMYAIHHGAKVVYDVDEHNPLMFPSHGVPFAQSRFAPADASAFAGNPKSLVHNPYPCFGFVPESRPRGFPPDSPGKRQSVRNCHVVKATGSGEQLPLLGIVQSLLGADSSRNHSTRSASDGHMDIKPGESRLTIVPDNMFTPYTAQATLHFAPAMWGLLLPTTLEQGASDILRSFMTQTLLSQTGSVASVSTPWVRQDHYDASMRLLETEAAKLDDQIGPMLSFLQLYRDVVTRVKSPVSMPQKIDALMISMYEHGGVGDGDVPLIQAWLMDLVSVGYEYTLKPDSSSSTSSITDKNGDSEDSTAVVSRKVEKPHTLLVIAVVSVRPERRDVIRNTWLRWGDDRVVLRFFTEGPSDDDPDADQNRQILEAEQAEHGDLIILDIERGMNFAIKLLEAMRWVRERYTFDFFLRLDDDYFVCLDRLLRELEMARDFVVQKAPYIYAGFRYCQESSVRIDEAYLMLTSQLVDRILTTPDKTCGGHAGLTLGWWMADGLRMNENNDVRWVHDSRLDHHGDMWTEAGDKAPAELVISNVCRTHMGVHHTYPDRMVTLWEAQQRTEREESLSPRKHDPVKIFRYPADKICTISKGITDTRFARDNPSPCASFEAVDKAIHCGAGGCGNDSRGRL